MSNLLKRGTTISKNERVIDYNQLIREKMQAIQDSKILKASPDGFVSGINATVVEQLDSEQDNLSEDAVEEYQTDPSVIIEEANEQAQQIISQANAEANNVLEEANQEAQRIEEEARNRGYEEGMINARSEIDLLKQQLEQEYADKSLKLEKETEAYKAKLEPELVEVITEVFKSVVLTVAEDDENIILNLINGVMRNADNSHSFTIKVSPHDYKFLINNQGKIYTAISKDINIDIIEENSMDKNECIIETETGVFNCSLDIELDSLIKKIRLLSCVD